MVMVDEFEPHGDKSAHTALFVRSDNLFVNERGEFRETGIIEHMAQSASALAGYHAEGDKPPVGMIVEIKHFTFQQIPLSAGKIETDISFGFTFGQMTLVHAVSRVGGTMVADGEMKLFIA